MAKFNLPFGLNIAASDPTDTRQIVSNQAGRELLVDTGLAYEGMLVYQADSKDLYILRGTTNNDWQLASSGSEVMGEANTASNVGTGSGVFKQKTGLDLEFKSLVEGDNITITTEDNNLIINSDGGLVTAGIGITDNAGTFDLGTPAGMYESENIRLGVGDAASINSTFDITNTDSIIKTTNNSGDGRIATLDVGQNGISSVFRNNSRGGAHVDTVFEAVANQAFLATDIYSSTGYTGGAYVSTDSISSEPSITYNVNLGDSTNITQTEYSIEVTGSGSFPGIEYAGDYSNNYTDRSLIDKEYVDSIDNVLKAGIEANALAISNSASASMKLASEDTITAPTTETRYAFNISAPSTDTDILDADEVNDYVQFKLADSRYIFQIFMSINTTGAGDKTLTLRARTQVGDIELGDGTTISIDGGSNRKQYIVVPDVFIDTVSPDTDIYFTIEASDNEVDILFSSATIFVNTKANATNVIHNDTLGLQGGTPGEYYHLTLAERDKLAGLEDCKFLGIFTSLAALELAHPSPEDGSYAYVDQGVGSDVVAYIWDPSDNKYVLQLGESTAETPASIKSKYESNPDTNAFTDSDKDFIDNFDDSGYINTSSTSQSKQGWLTIGANSTPTTALDVRGAITTNNKLVVNNSSSLSLDLTHTNGNPGIQFKNLSRTGDDQVNIYGATDNAGSYEGVGFRMVNTGGTVKTINFNQTGIGIFKSPTAALDVEGNANFSGRISARETSVIQSNTENVGALVVRGSGNSQLLLERQTGLTGRTRLGWRSTKVSDGSVVNAALGFEGDSGNAEKDRLYLTADSSRFEIAVNNFGLPSAERSIFSAGTLSIGTGNTATEALDVNGNIKASGDVLSGTYFKSTLGTAVLQSGPLADFVIIRAGQDDNPDNVDLQLSPSGSLFKNTTLTINDVTSRGNGLYVKGDATISTDAETVAEFKSESEGVAGKSNIVIKRTNPLGDTADIEVGVDMSFGDHGFLTNVVSDSTPYGSKYNIQPYNIVGTSDPYLTIDYGSGFTGINTPEPTERLEVTGNIKSTAQIEGSTLLLTPQAAPTSPTEGTTYYDSTTKVVYVWDGTTWQNVY